MCCRLFILLDSDSKFVSHQFRKPKGSSCGKNSRRQMEIRGDKITEKHKVKSKGQINKSERIDTKQSFLLVTPLHQHLYDGNYKEKNKESINNNNDSLALDTKFTKSNWASCQGVLWSCIDCSPPPTLLLQHQNLVRQRKVVEFQSN